MRRRRREASELGAHPFRSLFDLMLALLFMLMAALILSGARQSESGDGAKERIDEMLTLHNLERRNRLGDGAKLLTSLHELANDPDCRRLAEADRHPLDAEEIRSLERHRDALWRQLKEPIKERLLSPTIIRSYGQDVLNFPSGSDVPTNIERRLPILEDVYRQYRAGYRRIRVEGHTDDVPIYTDHFHSNWELSAARAIWLAEQIESYLAERSVPVGRDGVHIEAIGYGDREPLPGNDNSTEEHRRLNRRIRIVFEK